MSETFLPDFLGGEPVSEEAPASEAAAAQPAAEAAPAAESAAAEPEAASAEGQARGADGKFVAAIAPVAEPAPQAAPAAQAEPAQPTAETDIAGKLAALLNERDKRQAVEGERDAAVKRANDLQAWRDQQEAQARRQPIPSREEDPAGYERHREAQFQSQLYDQNLRTSRVLAEVAHGKETVAKAFDWGFERCNSDPHFNAKVAASPDPVGVVVEEWKAAQLAEKFGSVDPTEFDAFQQWKAAQAAAPAQGQQPLTQPAAALAAAPVAPRPSLAAGPSAGRADAAQPGDAEAVFDGMFRR